LLLSAHEFLGLPRHKKLASKIELKLQTRISQIKNQEDYFQFIES